ncbi:MAG: hypothetical protein H7320_24540, partial [Ferruginibacter sp.]|nr:hypothetical protein [Ferruginibacter sp.]
MYTLLKKNELKKITKAELPAFFAALILTETMYHFGSFILEGAAFLASWFVFSFVLSHFFATTTGRAKKRKTV